MNNGYQQYMQQSINTMTNGEMLVLLYDESIKRLKVAELALEKQDFNLFEDSVDRVERIFRYLISILDRRYPISSDLFRMYDYFLYQIIRIKAGRRKDLIEEIRPMIVEFRDAFKEADKINSNQTA